jgi:hypothetical protein
MRALICWYKGEKVGDEPPAPPALAAAGLLFGLVGVELIGQDFTTKDWCRPEKTAITDLSYIRHKIELTDSGSGPTLPSQALYGYRL